MGCFSLCWVPHHADTVLYYYQDPHPTCPVVSDSAIITYRDSAMVGLDTTHFQICACEPPVSLTANLPGSWIGTGVTPGGVFDPCIGPGIYTLYFSSDSTTAEPCTSTVSLEIEVKAKPQVSVLSHDTLCWVMDTVSLPIGAPAGGMWTALRPATSGLLAATGSFDIGSFGLGTDTLIYSFRDMNSCVNSDTLLMTIIARDTAKAFPKGLEICRNNGRVQLAGQPAHGSWSGTGLVPPDQFDPLLSPGQNNYTLTYTIAANTTCESKDSIEISVLDTIYLEFLADTQICEDSEDFFFTISSSGGYWQGTGITDSLTGAFDPDSLAVHDSALICYVLIDSLTQCESQSCRWVKKRPLPQVVILPTDTGYCMINADLTLPSASPPGGLWSGPAVTDSSAGLFNPTLLPDTGCYTFYYFFTDAIGCSNLDSLRVCVAALDSVSAGIDFAICQNEAPLTLQGYPAGGTWSGGGSALAGNVFTPAIAALAINELIYTYGSGDCVVSDTLRIDVLPVPVVTAPLADTVCISDPPFFIASGNPMGGWWEGPGVMADSLRFDPMITGTQCQQLSYIYVHPVTGCADTAQMNLCVDSLPRPSFLLPDTLCIFDTLLFPNSSTYSRRCWWDYGDASPTDTIYDGYHAYQTAGNFQVCLICENTTGCLDSVKQNIFVNERGEPHFTPSPREGCGPALAVSLLDSSYGAGGRYYWYVCRPQGDSLLATGDENAPNVPSLRLPQGKADSVHHFKLCIVNDCDSVCYYDSVIVHPIPQVNWGPSALDGCSPLCIHFSNLSAGLADSFYWYIDRSRLFSTDSIPDSLCLTYYGYQDTCYELGLIAVNACGRDTMYHTVCVRPNDVDSFYTVSPQRGCAPLTATARDYTGYLWTAFDFGLPNTQVTSRVANYTYTQPGTYTVYQYVYNGCGRDTGAIQVIVDEPSWAGFAVSDSVVCPGDTILFQPDSLFFSHEWDFGDNSLPAYLAVPKHAYDTPGTYRVRHITRDSSLSLCPDTSYMLVRILPQPASAFSLNRYAGCPPLQVQVSQVEAGRRYAWDWDYNNNVAGVGRFPSHTYTQSGRYTVHLTILDTLTGCSADSSREVWVYDKPQSGFLPGDTTVCGIQTPISFHYLTNGAAAPHWDFGDNTSSNLQNPTHVFGQRGIFKVVLADTNAFLCVDSSIAYITVRPQPQASVLVQPDEACGPVTVNFIDQSQAAGSSYIWPGFGPWRSLNGSLALSYPAVSSPTTYDIMIAVDTLQECVDTAHTSLTINHIPFVSFQVDRDSACQGQANFCFTSQATDVEGIAAHFWSFGDGDTSFQENPCHPYDSAGIYEVILIVENLRGCVDSFSREVLVIPQPVAQAMVEPLSGCFPFEASLLNRSSHITNAVWRFGDGDSVAGIFDSLTHTYQGTAYQQFQLLLIVDHSGYCFDSLSWTLEGAELPEAAFDWEVIGDPCKPVVEIAVTNRSQKTLPNTTYRWDYSDDNVRTYDGFEPPHIFFGSPVSSDIVLVVENPLGCKDTVSQAIDLHRPRADFEVDIQAGCEDLTVTFTNLSEDLTHWYWDFGDGTISTDSMPTHTYTYPGVFDVKLFIDHNGDCPDTLIRSNWIRVFERPDPIMSIEKLEEVGLVAFEDISIMTGNRREWSLGDGTFRNDVSFEHQYETNGHFPISLYLQNEFLCDATAYDTVIVDDICRLFMPNSMMPNDGDPEARNFAVFHPAGVGFREFHISVYNRWGNAVWSSDSLDLAGRPAGFWDGRIGGDGAPAGVYTWKIHKAVCISGRDWVGKREGSVTLIR